MQETCIQAGVYLQVASDAHPEISAETRHNGFFLFLQLIYIFQPHGCMNFYGRSKLVKSAETLSYRADQVQKQDLLPWQESRDNPGETRQGRPQIPGIWNH